MAVGAGDPRSDHAVLAPLTMPPQARTADAEAERGPHAGSGGVGGVAEERVEAQQSFCRLQQRVVAEEQVAARAGCDVLDSTNVGTWQLWSVRCARARQFSPCWAALWPCEPSSQVMKMAVRPRWYPGVCTICGMTRD